MELNERLIAARAQAGFANAADAARALGRKYQTYAAHENGNSGFSAKTGALYARRFRVRFEWLMTGAGPMTDDDPDAARLVNLYRTANQEAKTAALAVLRLGQPQKE